MEERDVQNHQLQYPLLYQIRPHLVRAVLVSLGFNKSIFFNTTFSASAPKHKSAIFRRFMTRRLNTFSLFFLFNTISFNHYTYELHIFEIIDYESMVD